ncbi:MAG: Hpt domain-containing protein [Candidatus Accumulibacter sp.]|nr:Hpt domain-containing protein [Accumulibacter sp.]
MTASTDFDIGPLTWVKSEIDLALERGAKALHDFTASANGGSGDLTHLRFCRTHLHQVQGALTIVSLDGVTQFAEAVEALLAAVEQRQCDASVAVIDLAQRAIVVLGNYLDDLMSGQSNQALRLLPMYQEVQVARGFERAQPSDLFFPDLRIRPPRRSSAPPKIGQQETLRLLRNARSQFQRGLLAWLRNPRVGTGAEEMRDAVRRIEALQEQPPARAFWWVATAFLTALAEQTLTPDADARQLCTRIDLQIRRLLEGSNNVAERMLRDALYLVAKAKSSDRKVRRVKDHYRLASLLPDPGSAVPVAEESVRRRLREAVAATEEAWSKFCAGTTAALSAFKACAVNLGSLVQQTGSADYIALSQTLSTVASHLVKNPAIHSEALAMETATAILLAQHAQESLPYLGENFSQQVAVMVGRLADCLTGKELPPESKVPSLDEMSRLAHERLLNGQVAREIQSNLGQIEQVLDGFFRDATKRAELNNLEMMIRQIIGALTIMHHVGAVATLRKCATDIRKFASSDYVPQEADFERVAEELALVGFFVDALQHGPTDFAEFAAQMKARKAGAVVDEQALASVEQEIEQGKRETHALLAALKEQPTDASLRQEVQQNLASLQKDAGLIADKQLEQDTKDMLFALAAGSNAAQIDQAMATLQPPAAPQPSAATLQLAQASTEEVDAELLDIFLEEAEEVMSSIASTFGSLKEEPDNLELLRAVRRSVHTLKGSGRMVGLKDLGEAAWAVEQVLNLWLRQEQPLNPPLMALIDQSYTVFNTWIKVLRLGQGQLPDAAPLIVAANALRQDSETPVEKLLAITPLAPSQPVAASVSPPAAEPAVELAPASVEPCQPGEPLEGAGADTAEPPSALAEEIPWTVTPPPDAPGKERVPDAANEIILDFASDETIGHAAETDAVLAPEDSAPAVSPPPLTDSLTDRPRLSIAPGLADIFNDEAHAHLDTLAREFSLLELCPADPTKHEMYRAAHTLAGIAGTVGITSVNRLSRALEHALMRRNHCAHPDDLDALATIQQTIETLSIMLDDIVGNHEPAFDETWVDALVALYPAEVVSATPTGVAATGDAVPVLVTPAGETPAEEVMEDEIPEDVMPASELLALPTSPATSAGSSPLTAAAGSTPEIETVVERPVLVDELDEQLLPLFLEEAFDINQNIATQLQAWRSNPADDDPPRRLARLFHTLKGSARMSGAMNLGEMVHAIETRMQQPRPVGRPPLELIEDVESAFDLIVQSVEILQGGGQPPVQTAAVAALASTPIQATAEQSAVPSTDETSARAETPESDGDTGVHRATLRVRAELIDRLVNQAGELSIARSRIEGEMRAIKLSLLDLTENVIRLRRQLREVEIQAESQMQSRTAPTGELLSDFDPLEFDRFTRFQELTRMMAESVNDVATVQQNLLKNLDDANAAILAQSRMNRDVQQELMSIRMVPFGSIADRLYRIVRQAAKEVGKRANLEIKGGQLEIDRSVLDKMLAPLEHMLRNAIAHGLEDTGVRVAKGKPEIGEISLNLAQEGNEIIVTFADDGAGLDIDRLRQRGLAAGLLSAADAEDVERVVDLIFAPGLSTASEVSRLSGRGIGMDVLKSEVASLGGRIEVFSTPGQGTTFRLYLPLTLAITKALLVRSGGSQYAIPAAMIEQVLDLKEKGLERIRRAHSTLWNGNTYPFHYLPQLLGEHSAQAARQRQYWVLLLRSGSRRIALQIDELIGNQEVVVKNIGPQLARVIGIDGATVLGNGQVVLILNPVALASRERGTTSSVPAPEKAALPAAPVAPATAASVMIVDDSLTVRKITSRLLAREGYQVRTAKDGVDALEQLASDLLPDVLLLDIEMPRMDGFELARNLRHDTRLKHLPIIMITSRTADKHRRYAEELGVNHYLGKPYQEDELLALIASYVSARQRA